MTLIVPYFAQAQTAAIVIDGVTYRVPLIDSAGHFQVDVVSSALPALAATAAKQDTMITALQLIDDLRGALAAVAADRLNVNAYATGASEVKAARLGTVAPSTTRATVATPASGKKVRIVACQIWSSTDTNSEYEVYFGTGATILINPGKEIMDAVVHLTNLPVFGLSWPDGGGPVGAADDVVSLRTATDVDVHGHVVIHYREE